MKANQIYDSITRLDDPRAGVASLEDGELAALNELLGTLPASGIPLLITALVDEEIEQRWMDSQTYDPS